MTASDLTRSCRGAEHCGMCMWRVYGGVVVCMHALHSQPLSPVVSTAHATTLRLLDTARRASLTRRRVTLCYPRAHSSQTIDPEPKKAQSIAPKGGRKKKA